MRIGGKRIDMNEYESMMQHGTGGPKKELMIHW